MSYQELSTCEQSCPGDAMGTQWRAVNCQGPAAKAEQGERCAWVRNKTARCRQAVVILLPRAKTQRIAAWFGVGSCDSNSSTCINLAALCWTVYLQSPTDYNPVIELFSFRKCCLAFLPTSAGCLAFEEVYLWQGKRSRIFIRIQESVKWGLVQGSVFWHLGYPISVIDRWEERCSRGISRSRLAMTGENKAIRCVRQWAKNDWDLNPSLPSDIGSFIRATSRELRRPRGFAFQPLSLAFPSVRCNRRFL